MHRTRARYRNLLREDGSPALTVLSARPVKDGIVARVAGIDDKDAADALRGLRLHIPREALPEPDEDEFYHADLVGLAAHAPDGAEVGRIVAVHNFGAGDLVEVALAGSRRTELIPFTDAFVPEVDLARRIAVIRMPPSADDDAPPPEET